MYHDDQSVELAESLRSFADWIDAHPGVSIHGFDTSEVRFTVYCSEDEIRDSASRGDRWDKEYSEGYVALNRTFGLLELHLFCSRADVCEPKETRTEVVTEPDGDWLREQIAALKERQPTRTVEKVTVVEWECRPLTGPQRVDDAALASGGAAQ